MSNAIHRTPRGGALVLVIIAVGVASTLGLSLLAASSMQTQSASNAAVVTRANYLAESGINIAMHYLQHPKEYAGAMPDGFYPGQTDLVLEPGTAVTNEVLRINRNEYSVRATATITNGGRGAVSRGIAAVVKTIPTGNLTVTPLVDAITVNGDITLDDGMTVTGSPGAVRSLGTVTIKGSGRAIGDVVTDTVVTNTGGTYTGRKVNHRDATEEAEASSGTGSLLSALVEAVLFQPYTVTPATPTDTETLVLESTHVPDLKRYRYRNPITGVVLSYNSVKLATNSYTDTTLGSTLMNPGGVFWTDQDTTLNNVTLNGTLYLTNGAKLSIGPTGTTTVTAATRYPALVSSGDIELHSGAQLDVFGLVYVRKIAANPGATGRLSINGALALSDKIAPFPTDNYAGTVSVTYNSARAQIGGFGMSVADTDIKALQVMSWTGN